MCVWRARQVKRHLRGAISSMEGAFNAAFNIVQFDSECHTPMGHHALVPATWAGCKSAKAVVDDMQPGGGNGGEAACLLTLLKMDGIQAVFFLGDGGWSEDALIQAAGEAKRLGVVIHSIAFFTSGGGLPQIAELTGGTYREINGRADLEEIERPAPAQQSARQRLDAEQQSSDADSSGSGSDASDSELDSSSNSEIDSQV